MLPLLPLANMMDFELNEDESEDEGFAVPHVGLGDLQMHMNIPTSPNECNDELVEELRYQGVSEKVKNAFLSVLIWRLWAVRVYSPSSLLSLSPNAPFHPSRCIVSRAAISRIRAEPTTDCLFTRTDPGSFHCDRSRSFL